MVFSFLGFTVSLILISCDGASDNGEENNNEDSGANRDDFNSSDMVDIRTEKSGDQAENKVLNETRVLGYYNVFDDFDVNEEFSAGGIDFTIERALLADFTPYENAEDRFNEVDEFPISFLIMVINTDTEEDTLTEPDLFMAVSSAKVHT